MRFFILFVALTLAIHAWAMMPDFEMPDIPGIPRTSTPAGSNPTTPDPQVPISNTPPQTDDTKPRSSGRKPDQTDSPPVPDAESNHIPNIPSGGDNGFASMFKGFI